MLRTASWCGLMGLLLSATSAQAHFLWIEAEPQGDAVVVRSGFGEQGNWEAEYAGRVETTSYRWMKDGQARPLELKWDKEQGCFVGQVAAVAPLAVYGQSTWGLFGRGGSTESLLIYYPKAMVGPPSLWKDHAPATDVKLEIVPQVKETGILLKVVGDGKPLPEAKLKLYAPKARSSTSATSNASGEFLWPYAGAGKYSASVVWRVAENGKFEGKPYEGQMHGATITFELPSDFAANK